MPLTIRHDQRLCSHSRGYPISYGVRGSPIFFRATLCIARSLRQRRFCPFVCHIWYCVQQNESMILKCTPSDSPMISLLGKLWLVEKFARGHPQGTCQMRALWGSFLGNFRLICRHISNTVHFRHKATRTVIGNRMQAMCSLKFFSLKPSKAFENLNGGHSRRRSSA